MTTQETQEGTPSEVAPDTAPAELPAKDETKEVETQVSATEVETTEEKPSIPAMPEGGFEKFYNKETGAYDWANHAKDAEYRLKQAKARAPEPTTEAPAAEATAEDTSEEQAPVVAPIAATREELTQALAAKGLDVATFAAEITEKGELSHASLATLEKAGFPESAVKATIDAIRAADDTAISKAIESAGGMEAVEAAVHWAKISGEVDSGYLDNYNRAVTKGSHLEMQLAVQALVSRHQLAEATRPKLLEGDNASSGNDGGYLSELDWKEAMKDPRYGRDPDYMRSHERKTRLYLNRK